jgi:hypothetical protein
MADDIVLNPGVGGATVGADLIGGVDYQRIKLIHGLDGVNDGDVAKTNPLPVSDLPLTTGGGSDYHKVAAGTNNAANIKAAAGQVYGIKAFNVAAYPVFIKLYNVVGVPNPAVDTPVRTIGVQAGLRADDQILKGLAFALGIGIAIVKGIGDGDNTAVVASDCVVDVDYK